MSIDITRVKDELAKRALDVARHLLPNGIKQGQEWRVGSLGGERGQSLGIHLAGTKAGVWADFASGESGDLLDLWMKVNGTSLVVALKAAADWLGIAPERPAMEPKKTYARPPKPKCSAPQGKVRDYLCEVRNIPLDVLTTYKIGEQGDRMIFPFLLPGGELAMAKFRVAEDGAKPQPTSAGCEPVLFGWQAIPDNTREVVLTEGEIDCLSWAAYGFPAMSIPFGGGSAGKHNWIEREFDRLARFERIYLAMDMDEQGQKASDDIAERLGRHRCYRVTMPFKDGNECLVNGVPKGQMQDAIKTASNLDPDGLRKPTEYRVDVVNLFWPNDGTHIGYKTPYGKLDGKLHFRPTDMTLWTGASGAGKSQVLSDCAVDWIKQGSRVCISSLEMRSPVTLRRMCKQITGVDRPTEPAIGASLVWLEQGLLLYDAVGKASVGKLLEVFDYARAKYGCDQFVIDSLMRLGISGDDYNGQEKAVFQLVDWTMSKKVHMHLVAHARKGGADNGAPETEDVKGAMEIGANSANIISIWRNRKGEDEIRKLELAVERAKSDALAEVAMSKLAEEREKPGVLLNVAKQRNGDFEGKVALWFDQQTYRYYSSHDRGAWSRAYLDNSDVVSFKDASYA